MLYAHKDHLFNLDEIEVAVLGRDSARLMMTNGDTINFLSGAEDLIAALENMDVVRGNNKLFVVRNISKVICTDSMALIQMKSGYQETIRGEDAVRQLLEAVGSKQAPPKGYAPPRTRRPAMVGKQQLREEGDE